MESGRRRQQLQVQQQEAPEPVSTARMGSQTELPEGISRELRPRKQAPEGAKAYDLKFLLVCRKDGALCSQLLADRPARIARVPSSGLPSNVPEAGPKQQRRKVQLPSLCAVPEGALGLPARVGAPAAAARRGEPPLQGVHCLPAHGT